MRKEIISIRILFTIVLAWAMFFGSALQASGASKKEKIIELMKISGVYDMVEAERVDRKVRAQAVREMSKKESQTGFKIVPEQYWSIEQQAYEEFERTMKPFDFSTDEFISKWAEFYGEELTVSDIEEILKYYKSKIGKKDLAAQLNASVKWNKYRLEGYEMALKKATRDYNTKLSEFTKRYIQNTQAQPR